MQGANHSFLLLSMYRIPSRFYRSRPSQSTDAIPVCKLCRTKSEARSDPDTDSDIRPPRKRDRPPTGSHNAAAQISFLDCPVLHYLIAVYSYRSPAPFRYGIAMGATLPLQFHRFSRTGSPKSIGYPPALYPTLLTGKPVLPAPASLF